MNDDTRRKLTAVTTATLTTCLLKRGFRNAWMQNVHPVAPGLPTMVGPAFTLRYVSAR